MTKREILTKVLAIANGAVATEDEMSEIATFATNEIAAIDGKNAKASARRLAKTKAANSALVASIMENLTDTPVLLSDIANAMGTSTNKIQGTLSAMAKAGTVIRTEIRVGKNKKVAYHVA